MKAHEIFKRMSAERASEIFTYLQREDKPIYKTAIQGLANQRNLRGVFIERKPPQERHPWMQNALGRPLSEMLASHLLQAWLLGAHKPMLNEFLDALEIPHDPDGTVETVPSAPPKEKVAAAVERLLAKYPAETVAIYLRVFREMDSAAQWPPLNEILNEDERLKL